MDALKSILGSFSDFIQDIVDYFKKLVKSIRNFNDTTHIS